MSIATVAEILKVVNAEVKEPVRDKFGYLLEHNDDYYIRRELRNGISQAIGKNYREAENGYVFTKTDVQAYLARELDNILMHRLGKGVRPWQIVNVTKKLDKDQPWIGIEYETGFQTGDEYRKVASYMWNNHKHSAIDGEGGSQFPCELTFSPVTYDVFMSDDCPLDQLYGFMAKENVKVPEYWGDSGYDYDDDDYDDGEEEIGTHCNISTPAFRALEWDKKDDVTAVMNASLGTLSETALETLFCRIPYGGFYHNGVGAESYIEGKLFRSSHDHNTWKNYKKVIGKIAECIEHLSGMDIEVTTRGTQVLVIKNFRKFLLGEDEEIITGWTARGNINRNYDW